MTSTDRVRSIPFATHGRHGLPGAESRATTRIDLQPRSKPLVRSRPTSRSGSACAVRFETGDFQATLPALLDGFLAGGGRTSEICVVACHACTHLTDRIIAMCIERRVDFAVMPCCQRDTLTQGQLSIAAKDLGIREGEAIDIARLGSVVARGYDCRWRTIDKKITPVNRLLVGLANVKPNVAFHRQQVERNADAKMVQIYSRLLGMSPAHGPATPPPAEDSAAGEQEAAGTTLAARAGSEGQ